MKNSKLVLLALVAVFATSAMAQKAPSAKRHAKAATVKKAQPKMQCCCMGMMQPSMMQHRMMEPGMMQPGMMHPRMMEPGMMQGDMMRMHEQMMQMHGQMGAPRAVPGMPMQPSMGFGGGAEAHGMPKQGMGMMMDQMDPEAMARMMAASAKVDDAMAALESASSGNKLDAAVAVIKAMNEERRQMHGMMHKMMGGHMRSPRPIGDPMATPVPASPPPSK
jgi:hypothetical protein